MFIQLETEQLDFEGEEGASFEEFIKGAMKPQRTLKRFNINTISSYWQIEDSEECLLCESCGEINLVYHTAQELDKIIADAYLIRIGN